MLEGRIFIDRWRLRFQSGDVTVEIPLERLVITCDLKTDGRICFSDRGQPEVRCYTVDETVLNFWVLVQSRHTRPQLQKIAGRYEISRRVKLTLYAFLFCIVLVWGGMFVFNALVRVVVKEIPAEWERKFGDTQLAKLGEDLDFLDDTNGVRQLEELATPLIRALPGDRNDIRFHIIELPEPNAVALPGGHVLVTTGLLKMADRPEQLLGVLAHEFAHVKRRHGFQQAISGAGPILIMQILLSDRNNRLNIMAKVSGLLIYQTFSQNYEREADAVGWDYLRAANIDPRGMIEMLRKLKEEAGDDFGGPQAFSSHPALDKRIRTLETKWDKLDRKTGFLVITNAIPTVPGMDQERIFRQLIRSRSNGH